MVPGVLAIEKKRKLLSELPLDCSHHAAALLTPPPPHSSLAATAPAHRPAAAFLTPPPRRSSRGPSPPPLIPWAVRGPRPSAAAPLVSRVVRRAAHPEDRRRRSSRGPSEDHGRPSPRSRRTTSLGPPPSSSQWPPPRSSRWPAAARSEVRRRSSPIDARPAGRSSPTAASSRRPPATAHPSQDLISSDWVISPSVCKR